jgi:15-cis-phytoene synthase
MSYCLDLVRLHDKDRFLASLFAPEAKRPHLWALYAFNAEITRIRESVSEPALGEIRLQWWHDTIDGIYAREKQDHPVAIELAAAIQEGDLPKHALQNLVKAHSFDFYSDPMPTLGDLEGYLGDTSSALIQMASLILAGEEALSNAEASGLAGVAQGLTTLLRSIPMQRSYAQCFVPEDMLKRRALSPTDFLSGGDVAALGVVLSELRTKAQSRLQEARTLAWTIKPAAMPAFLHLALTDAYLAAVLKSGDAILTNSVNIAQWRKQWILWKAARSEIF